MNGSAVVQKDIPDNNKVRIDVQSYREGVYSYEIRGKAGVLFKEKVVIERP
ncbi:MAG: hypothetical protein JNL13_02335 [Chitinophagaceae bacterium]|nr:hypothetical protein [Chitinophagaceae bacterium]